MDIGPSNLTMVNNTIIENEKERMVYEIKENKIAYNVMKRITDILLSMVGLVVLSPVFLVIGIIIKLDSKGPIFFAHNRIGKSRKKY